jgi:hypothetical protein
MLLCYLRDICAPKFKRALLSRTWSEIVTGLRTAIQAHCIMRYLCWKITRIFMKFLIISVCHWTLNRVICIQIATSESASVIHAYQHYASIRNQDSSVHIAACYGRKTVVPFLAIKILLLLYRVSTGYEANPASFAVGTAVHVPRVKQQEREADHSYPSSAEVNKDGAISTHTCSWSGARLIKHKDIFTLTYLLPLRLQTFACFQLNFIHSYDFHARSMFFLLALSIIIH